MPDRETFSPARNWSLRRRTAHEADLRPAPDRRLLSVGGCWNECVPRRLIVLTAGPCRERAGRASSVRSAAQLAVRMLLDGIGRSGDGGGLIMKAGPADAIRPKLALVVRRSGEEPPRAARLRRGLAFEHQQGLHELRRTSGSVEGQPALAEGRIGSEHPAAAGSLRIRARRGGECRAGEPSPCGRLGWALERAPRKRMPPFFSIRADSSR